MSEDLQTRSDLEYASREPASRKREQQMFDLQQLEPVAPGATHWTCPKCREVVRVDHNYGLQYASCECGRKAEREAAEEYKARNRGDVVLAYLGRAQIPKRFANARLDTFEKRKGTEEAIATCRRYVREFVPGKTSTGLLFAGGFGSGKTHLAISIAQGLIEKALVEVRFVATGGLLQGLKASDFDWTDIERATAVEVLILDDLAQDAMSTHDRGVLFNLVNERYEEDRPTIFTTNAGEKQLTEILGGALYSRLCEMAELVQLRATDYRRRSG